METFSNSTTNNILINFNINVAINIFVYVFLGAVAATSAYKLAITIFEKFLDAMQQRWLARFQHRGALSLEVIKICNEATVGWWNKEPRDIEHIYYIARLLEKEDKKAGENFNILISSWFLTAAIQKDREKTSEELRFRAELKDRAEEAQRGLMKAIKSW